MRMALLTTMTIAMEPSAHRQTIGKVASIQMAMAGLIQNLDGLHKMEQMPSCSNQPSGLTATTTTLATTLTGTKVTIALTVVATHSWIAMDALIRMAMVTPMQTLVALME